MTRAGHLEAPGKEGLFEHTQIPSAESAVPLAQDGVRGLLCLPLMSRSLRCPPGGVPVPSQCSPGKLPGLPPSSPTLVLLFTPTAFQVRARGQRRMPSAQGAHCALTRRRKGAGSQRRGPERLRRPYIFHGGPEGEVQRVLHASALSQKGGSRGKGGELGIPRNPLQALWGGVLRMSAYFLCFEIHRNCDPTEKGRAPKKC